MPGSTSERQKQVTGCIRYEWFNLIKTQFEWQDEYFAVSISESMIGTVREYIKKQEEHHKHKTFQEEYDEFILKYGFQRFNDK